MTQFFPHSIDQNYSYSFIQLQEVWESIFPMGLWGYLNRLVGIWHYPATYQVAVHRPTPSTPSNLCSNCYPLNNINLLILFNILLPFYLCIPNASYPDLIFLFYSIFYLLKYYAFYLLLFPFVFPLSIRDCKLPKDSHYYLFCSLIYSRGL